MSKRIEETLIAIAWLSLCWLAVHMLLAIPLPV